MSIMSRREVDPAEDRARRELLYGSHLAFYVSDAQRSRRLRKPVQSVSPSAKAYAEAMAALKTRINHARRAAAG